MGRGEVKGSVTSRSLRGPGDVTDACGVFYWVNRTIVIFLG
jgi:hypothetical protein